MSDHVAARLKQIQEARDLMKEKERLEEVKRKHCSIVQCIPHDKMLQRITESYSSRR